VHTTAATAATAARRNTRSTRAEERRRRRRRGRKRSAGSKHSITEVKGLDNQRRRSGSRHDVKWKETDPRQCEGSLKRRKAC
jgi:hypothetical protein